MTNLEFLKMVVQEHGEVEHKSEHFQFPPLSRLILNHWMKHQRGDFFVTLVCFLKCCGLVIGLLAALAAKLLLLLIEH